MELWCGNGKQVYSPNLTFDPLTQNQFHVKVNIYVKYHHCMSCRIGVMVQKQLLHRRIDRQTDRQPAMVKLVYVHNFIGGGIQTYFKYWKIVEKLPPGGQNCMGGVTFSRRLVQNLMLKYDPCQLLTLPNYILGITFQLLKLLRLAKDHWRGFSTRNAHMTHIVN